MDGDLQEFLGLGVRLRLAVLGDVILVFFGSVVCSGTAQKFMSDFGLVLRPVLRVVVLKDRCNAIREWDSRLWDRGRLSTSLWRSCSSEPSNQPMMIRVKR